MRTSRAQAEAQLHGVFAALEVTIDDLVAAFSTSEQASATSCSYVAPTQRETIKAFQAEVANFRDSIGRLVARSAPPPDMERLTMDMRVMIKGASSVIAAIYRALPPTTKTGSYLH